MDNNNNLKKRKEHPTVTVNESSDVLLGQQWSDDTEEDAGYMEQPPFKKRRLMGLLDAARIVSVAPSMEAPITNNDGQVLVFDDTTQQEAAYSRAQVNNTGLVAVQETTGAFSTYEMTMTKEPITETTTIDPPPDYSFNAIMELHDNNSNDERLDARHQSVETVASTDSTTGADDNEAIQVPAAHGHEADVIFEDAFENEDDSIPSSVPRKTGSVNDPEDELTHSERNDESEEGEEEDGGDDDDDETESEDSIDNEENEEAFFSSSEDDGQVEEDNHDIDTLGKEGPSTFVRLATVWLPFILIVGSLAFIARSSEYSIPETLQSFHYSIPKWTNFSLNWNWNSGIGTFLERKLDPIKQKTIDSIMDMLESHSDSTTFSFHRVHELLEESAASLERLGKISVDSSTALTGRAKQEIREAIDQWTDVLVDFRLAVTGHAASIYLKHVMILNQGLRSTLELCASLLAREKLVWLWEHWKDLMETSGLRGQSYSVQKLQQQSRDIAAQVSELESAAKRQHSRIERIWKGKPSSDDE